MSDESAPTEEPPITFHVKSSGDTKYTLTLPLTTTIIDLKTKLATPELSDTSADRLRLIYSGRVMKDPDTLNTYKVKENHTIHLVKSAQSNQRQNPASQGAAAPTTGGAAAGGNTNQGIPGVPTNFAAGTGNNPLAGLTGARYAGFAQLPGAGMFGPDGGMGPPPDPEQMIQMMRNPQFQSTMNEALQNPAIIDMMIQQNPMLRDMGPGIRQMMQSPEFRRMMTDPDALAQQMNMQRALGLNPFGGGGAGQTAFPAPGATNTTESGNNATGTTQNPNPLSPPAFNPFAAMGGANGANPFAAMAGANGANPFAALFGQPPAAPGTPSTSPPPAGQTAPQGTTPTTTQDNAQAGTNPSNAAANPNPFAMLFDPNMLNAMQPPTQPSGTNPASPPPQNNPFANNPFLQNPQLLQQFMGAMNPQNPSSPPPAGGIPNMQNNPMLAQLIAGLGGQAGTPTPADTRPPEERYEQQLRQLNDMGFYEFERNVEALRRTGGSVQGAVEYLLTHP